MDTQEIINKMKAWSRNQKEFAELADSAAAALEGTLQTQAIELENRYRDEIDRLREQVEGLIPEQPDSI